jgi:hypothetical protein
MKIEIQEMIEKEFIINTYMKNTIRRVCSCLINYSLLLKHAVNSQFYVHLFFYALRKNFEEKYFIINS